MTFIWHLSTFIRVVRIWVMAGYTVVTLNTGLYLNIRYLSFNIFHFHNSPDAYGMKPFRTVLWFGNKQIGHNKTVLRGDEDSLISIWFIAFLSPVIDYRLYLYQGQVGWGKSEPQFWSFWQSSISHSRVKSLLVSKFLSTRKSTLHYRAKFKAAQKSVWKPAWILTRESEIFEL